VACFYDSASLARTPPFNLLPLPSLSSPSSLRSPHPPTLPTPPTLPAPPFPPPAPPSSLVLSSLLFFNLSLTGRAQAYPSIRPGAHHSSPSSLHSSASFAFPSSDSLESDLACTASSSASSASAASTASSSISTVTSGGVTTGAG
ncbi:unnamed protein product, partial [Closterium sp. Naga37s-1]